MRLLCLTNFRHPRSVLGGMSDHEERGKVVPAAVPLGVDPCCGNRQPTVRSARRMSPADSEHEPRLTTEEDLRAVVIGTVIPHNAPVTLAEYDPRWPALFD